MLQVGGDLIASPNASGLCGAPRQYGGLSLRVWAGPHAAESRVAGGGSDRGEPGAFGAAKMGAISMREGGICGPDMSTQGDGDCRCGSWSVRRGRGDIGRSYAALARGERGYCSSRYLALCGHPNLNGGAAQGGGATPVAIGISVPARSGNVFCRSAEQVFCGSAEQGFCWSVEHALGGR